MLIDLSLSKAIDKFTLSGSIDQFRHLINIFHGGSQILVSIFGNEYIILDSHPSDLPVLL